MKFEALQRAIPLILVLAYSSPCEAAASVAKRPTSVSQGYSDGSSTELVCFDASCRFSILKSGKKASFELARVLLGYRIEVGSYSFHEETRKDPFLLSLQVSCSDEDLGLLPGLDTNTAECDMQLGPRSGVLIATHIRVSGIVGEKYVSRLRKLHHSSP